MDLVHEPPPTHTHAPSDSKRIENVTSNCSMKKKCYFHCQPQSEPTQAVDGHIWIFGDMAVQCVCVLYSVYMHKHTVLSYLCLLRSTLWLKHTQLPSAGAATMQPQVQGANVPYPYGSLYDCPPHCRMHSTPCWHGGISSEILD